MAETISPETIALITTYINATAAQLGLDAAQCVRQCQAESDFDQEAHSPAGALGLFQLEPATARSLGVDASAWKQNVYGGLHYMRMLSARYKGDQKKALAAYNWGEGRVDRAVATFAGSWLVHAPEETQNYIAKIWRSPAPPEMKNVSPHA